MDRGHIKLWRKSFDSGIIQNANLWTFWTWCLLKASWKKRNVIVNFQHVEIEPGQFIFGRKVAAYELKMSEQVIRTCLKSLQKMKNVTIKTTNKYSIISIVNWDSYQGLQPTTNQQVNQQLTSNQPATNQQLTTDKKERKKEVKESKEIIHIDSTESEFENFWNAFNKKTDKVKCLRKWKKLTHKEKVDIFQCLSAYVKSKPDPQFRKNPLTWLNGKCWNDDIINSGQYEKKSKNEIEHDKFTGDDYYGKSSTDGKENPVF